MTPTRESPAWKNARCEMRAIRNIFLLLPVLALLYASTLHAATVVLNPARGTTIYDGSVAAGTIQNNSCGAGMDLFTGNNTRNTPKARRALMAFDIVGNIPAGAAINNVTLTATLNFQPHLNRRAANLFLMPQRRDRLVRLRGIDEIRRLPTLHSMSIGGTARRQGKARGRCGNEG